jgi:DNA-binding CsgD family transcriptional regulator
MYPRPSRSVAERRPDQRRFVRRSRAPVRPCEHGAGPRIRPFDLKGVLLDAADGVFAVDARGRIVFWNRSARSILGYAARDVVGRLCCEVFARSDGPGTLCYNGCHVATIPRPAASNCFDLATRTRSGEPIRLVGDFLIVAGAGGERSAILHLFRDLPAWRAIAARKHRRPVPVRAEGGPSSEIALTPRELEVLRLVASGANTRAVAAHLRVTPATVRNHVQNMFGKLGVHSRLEAAAYAARHGMLGPEQEPSAR